MDHPFHLANKLRSEGLSYRVIGKKLTKAGYLTVTGLPFGLGTTHRLIMQGEAATYKTKEKCHFPKSVWSKKPEIKSQGQNTDASMIIDIAKSNIPEHTKTAVISLIARSL